VKSFTDLLLSAWCGTQPPTDPAARALGWMLIGAAAIAVVFAFVQAVRLAWRPGEEAPDHVKRSIFDDGMPDA
jgi:hypothetical protein